MGLGILESRSLEHVPGTTRYYDDPNRPQVANGADHGLKVDASGKLPIILIPQPSDDPNDPLNWPLWRRDLITFTLSMAAIFATALGPILAANTVVLSLWFGESLTKTAMLTGYFLLGVGGAAIFFVPSGRVWGKRHLFILGLIILVGSAAWGGAVGTNYKSFIGARVIQGVGCSPYETLVNVAVGDLYPVHQRGIRMAFTNLAVFGGAFFTPILVGKITGTIGWEWTFYFTSIFLALSLVAVVLFCPETAFRRDMSLNIDMVTIDTPAPVGRASPSSEGQNDPSGSEDVEKLHQTGEQPAPVIRPAAGPAVIPPKKTWVQSLALFDGRKTDDSYFELLLRPFPLFLQPAFFWGCLIQGTMIGWTVFIGVIVAATLLMPPFFWSEVEAGYAYAAPFIGALCGFAIAGLFSDWSAKYMTSLNGGIYEPEFRILMVFPMFIIGGIGLFGFALTSGELITGKYAWPVPLTFFAFEVAGMVIGAVASSLYIVDAYRDLAIEGFTCMAIFKNFLGFGLTFSAYDWIIQSGPRTVMLAISIVQVVVCATSIPMYIYGKRVRAYYHKHDLLRWTKGIGRRR
ncbi:major facilitator superfamily domain-containing protein [Plectosphaerella cucumerina]|uniref:Major facilitator superfamily domain-containing protein n=1 Tax=Plectosphaerella cucumerina TaxID=40658 RepID=A0A8K0X9E5_9PEZI|nr:major facilitator superfamily domain-containing protein [Plectosphaerella cucumerina]